MVDFSRILSLLIKGAIFVAQTYSGESICETIVAIDINSDSQGNRAELEIMALHWTDEEPLPLS
jgi:hypothetical protein